MTATHDATAEHMTGSVVLGSAGTRREDVLAVARHGAPVVVAPTAYKAIGRAREAVEAAAASDHPVYGVSTGFGALATRRISPEGRRDLQKALVRSHAAGMGDPVEAEVVRAMMFLRARTLAMGFSGVTPETVDLLVGLLNAHIVPVVPEHGSLGCSGDLAPLAHVALALIGEGEVDVEGRRLAAEQALAAAALAPIVLGPKEGLALINGTDGMLGMLVLACADIERLLKVADIAAAVSVEGLLGTDRAFAPELVGLRPHPGQQRSAANLARLLAGSGIVESHREDDPRVQDAYSLRCAPQVLGAARDTLEFASAVADRELRAVVDNPVVLPDGRLESVGNFHGAPLAYACDFLAIALADVASIAERRIDRLLDPTRSHGLPPFLADDPGVDSGLMIAQYTAAALVAESRRLAAPASVDSIPTSAMQEDHVSMGWGAARKLRTVVDNVFRVLAIELVVGSRAVDLRSPPAPAPGTGAAVRRLREAVPGPGADRYAAPELAAAADLARHGAVLDAVEAQIGPLA